MVGVLAAPAASAAPAAKSTAAAATLFGAAMTDAQATLAGQAPAGQGTNAPAPSALSGTPAAKSSTEPPPDSPPAAAGSAAIATAPVLPAVVPVVPVVASVAAAAPVAQSPISATRAAVTTAVSSIIEADGVEDAEVSATPLAGGAARVGKGAKSVAPSAASSMVETTASVAPAVDATVQASPAVPAISAQPASVLPGATAIPAVTAAVNAGVPSAASPAAASAPRTLMASVAPAIAQPVAPSVAPVDQKTAVERGADVTPGTPAVAAVPTVLPTQAPNATAVAASTQASPAAAPTPLATQLSRPIFTLATGPSGEHTLVINVAPDNLGPVTVHAHVSADGIRVELFAPTDVGRDAIRAILPDLRKDLASSGMNSNLNLSSQNQPTDRGDGGAPRERFVPDSSPSRPCTSTTDQTAASPRGPNGTSTTIDVMV